MEIIVLFVLWIISIPLCINSAKKIKSNRVVAAFAGICAPVLAPIVYYYLASNSKKGLINKDEVFKQIGIVVVAMGILYFIVNLFR